MRKAQITMESLLLYGAAILVVLLAIAALTYFGVLDLGRYLPEKCNFESSGVFKCEEYQVDITGDTISIVLSNTGTKSIVVQNGATFDATDTGITGQCTSSDTPTIIPGDTGRIDFSCSFASGMDDGDRVAGTMNVPYMFTDGTLTMNAQGDFAAS